MIGLILAMLRARPGRALTAMLLAIVAVAAAVAGPAFLAAADRSVIADELSRATPYELTVEATASVDLSQPRDRTFESGTVGLLTGPGLTPVFAAEFTAYFTGPADGDSARLVFRQGFCAHLRMVAGRCPIGTNEIAVGRATAARLGVHNGQTVVERESVLTKDGPTATGPPAVLSVVGVYEVPDPSDRYWADQHYFDSEPGSQGQPATGEPVFTGRGTLEALTHTKESQSVDSLLDPAALTPQNLATIRASVSGAQHRAASSAISASSGTPALLKRIDTDRSTLREVVPLAAVPLVVLAWLVMLLAAGYATEARRAEVGLLKLRGTSAIPLWWLVLGESVVAILIGSAVGYLVGYAVVAVAAHLLLSGAGAVAPSWQALRWAGVAVLGTLVATLLAQRRPFAAPVADLLRQVPPRGGWRGLALEAMLYPLTVAAVVQLKANPGKLTGIMLLAPGLVVLTVALLVARAVGPLAGWIGRRALRAGRLGLALGALRLARRPGAARLLALLVVAVAQLGLAVTAAGVASRADSERVAVEQGAARVLDVTPVDRGQLLNAVRAADPTGRYAMAVATVPALVGTDSPTLEVDSTRLAAVANWRTQRGSLSAAQTAAALHPAAPDPVTFTTETIGVDLTTTRLDLGQRLSLIVHLAPVDGSPAQVVNLGELVPGRHTYAGTLPGCDHGCRLIGFEVAQPSGAGFSLDAVLHGLFQGDPATPMDVGLTQSGRWRAPGRVSAASVPTVAAGPDGLTVTLRDDGGLGVDPWILPADAPYPLPVVLTGRLGRDTLGGLDNIPQPVVSAGTAAILPRLGANGILVDFQYAERDARDTGVAIDPQVWVAADAPANLVDRLRQNGLTIVDGESNAARLRYLDGQGPAAGLRFHLLAGALAVILAVGGLVLIATVDRRATGQLRALRVQGVPRATVAAANRYGYVGLVLAALVLGPLAAGGAWLLTGRSIPLFADGVRLLPPPLWPHWPPLFVAWAAAGLLLLGVALAAARLLSAGLHGRRGERG